MMNDVPVNETQTQASEGVAATNKQEPEAIATSKKRKRSAKKSAKPRKEASSLCPGKERGTDSKKKRKNMPKVGVSDKKKLKARKNRKECSEAYLKNCMGNLMEDDRISVTAMNKVSEIVAKCLEDYKSRPSSKQQ